jgi:hypothetical protein
MPRHRLSSAYRTAAAWERVHHGTASPADEWSWRRFADFGTGTLSIDRRELLTNLYTPLWNEIAARPCLDQYLGDYVPRPTPLPSLGDLFVAADRIAAERRSDDRRALAGAIAADDLDASRRVILSVVVAVDGALVALGMMRWGAERPSPAYPSALPSSTWGDAAEAVDEMDADSPFRRDVYFLLAAPSFRFGTREGDHVFLISTATSRKRGLRVSGVCVDNGPRRYERSLFERTRAVETGCASMWTRNTVHAWLAVFMAALVATPPDRLDDRRAHRPRNEGDDDRGATDDVFASAIGVQQVRRAMVALTSIEALPPLASLRRLGTAAGLLLDNALRDASEGLAGTWITKAQFTVAVTAFAGQVSARLARPLFSRSSSLFDAAADACVSSPDAIRAFVGNMHLLPLDVIERSAARVWCRICAGSPRGADGDDDDGDDGDDGTLRGGGSPRNDRPPAGARGRRRRRETTRNGRPYARFGMRAHTGRRPVRGPPGARLRPEQTAYRQTICVSRKVAPGVGARLPWHHALGIRPPGTVRGARWQICGADQTGMRRRRVCGPRGDHDPSAVIRLPALFPCTYDFFFPFIFILHSFLFFFNNEGNGIPCVAGWRPHREHRVTDRTGISLVRSGDKEEPFFWAIVRECPLKVTIRSQTDRKDSHATLIIR